MNTNGPETLMEAVQHFTLDACHNYMVNIKWPDGVINCPECGCTDVGVIASRRMFQCKSKECRKQFSTKVGTIFEDSALGLDKWFVAVWSITNAKNGISSCELARAIGITQKSAWHMLHRVRHAMGSGTFQMFSGVCESDETYIGGKSKNMHKSRRREAITGSGVSGKTVVHGIIERSDSKKKASKVKATVVPNARKSSIHPIIENTIEGGSTIYTDSLQTYTLMSNYIHDYVNHAEEYVRGAVHTNGMENFWSLLKRSIHGTYVSVDVPHLQRYVDEQVLRFNERKTDDAGRFAKVMPGVVGKRLTYAALIGASEAAPESGTDGRNAGGNLPN